MLESKSLLESSCPVIVSVPHATHLQQWCKLVRPYDRQKPSILHDQGYRMDLLLYLINLMQSSLKIQMAQINVTVGALADNAEKIMRIIRDNQADCDVLLFPEHALTGYPLEDLLFHRALYDQVEQTLQTIQAAAENCHVILGHPSVASGHHFNSASVLFQGKRIALYHKQHLPNYGVFDEHRYFTAGPAEPCVFMVKGYRLGICICEDLWQRGPVEQLSNAKVDCVLSLNASPFEYNKHTQRETLLRHHAEQGVAIVYINLTGGQDELVFDGQSIAFDRTGTLCARAPAFRECLHTITLKGELLHGEITPLLSEEALIYQALVCGLHDYVEKNGFPGVLLGLSGGIDSALTLALAVDALGASRVHAVMLPSRYTAAMSGEDAKQQLGIMQVPHSTFSIESVFESFLATLQPAFSGLKPDITEENLQSRIRGTLLMALSNKTGKMLLSTSNKSESAVGYATLYGDMAGGFSVLKDILKTQVYTLARYRNTLSPVIPERVLTRAPSAELAENQKDQDSLPDYTVLDAIITYYIEDKLSPEEIIRQGYARADVEKTIRLLTRNEFKRRQAAPGVKIRSRAFGRDWRYPITSKF